MRRHLAIALEITVPIALLVIWGVWSASGDTFYFPPLTDILQKFQELWLFDRVGSDVWPSLQRLILGYAIACAVAVAIGIPLGLNPLLRRATSPIVEFLRAIPPPALVPVLILLAGIGDTMKVLVIVSGCIWPVLLNTVEGVRGADEVLGDTCRTYRITGRLRLYHFVLRSASPQIMAGARQALSIGLILMVISELKAANEGLGFTVREFQTGFQIPEMWSGVLLLGIIGVVLSLLFRLVERRVLGWYHGVRAAERGSL